MELKAFVLFCTLISSIAAFSIENGLTQFDDSDSLAVIAQNDGCKCKNGRCVKDNRGKTKCNCKRGYALQDEFTCEECDCGSKGKCMFVGLSKSTGGFSYVKKCICDLGSAEKDGVCVDCRCGENSKCEFEDGEKVCYCIEGYAEKAGVCTKCDCGPDGECTFNNGRKICTCDEDYEDINGYCQHKCDRYECKNGGLCQSQNGKPVCTCPHRYYGTHCEIDKCDAINCKNGGICKTSGGIAVCDCPEKYEGRECEIDKCSYLNCQNGYKCVIKDSKAVCDCNLRVFPKYTGKNCEKATCSTHYQCQNGAECKDGTCICRPGTSGGFCDIIDQCPDLCPRRSDINCTYDVKSEKAYCDCLDRNLGYFPDTKECKRTCDPSQCKNGGNCKYEELGLSRFCRCLEGTTGDYCEDVPACRNMNCGTEASCQYDVDRKTAICKCRQNGLAFDPADRTCKRTCDPSQCKNGGSCNYDERGLSRFCRCLEGTTGDFCEDIPSCRNIDCGAEASCQYDVGRKSAFCKCRQNGLSFDPADRKCKRTCDPSQCKNGGSCNYDERGLSRFCRCLEGTTGDFCEDIPACRNINCGTEASCQYDVGRKSAFCKCRQNGLTFDSTDRKCKRTCDPSQCKNGGNCNYDERGLSRFCRCLDGTAGDFCEDIPACRNINCGTEASCQYDVGGKSAFCKCRQNGLTFDPTDRKCKQQCRDSSDCKNGGSCTGGQLNKFCRCLNGTIGDFCEEVPACDNKDCGKDAKCVFDIGSKSASCKCFDTNLAFDELGKVCKRTCKDNSQCNNGGRCLARVNNWFCHCLEGTSGDFCENVTICNVKCGNGNGVVCKYDFNQKIAECLCKDEKYEFDAVTKSCKLCDCGGKEISCNVRDGKKTCICPNGYVDENGKCKKKFCTDNKCLNGKCDVVNEQEVCTCYEGFYLEGDECKRKQCTKTPCVNGTCVVRNGGFETCVCPSGYTLRGGLCIRGKCSMHTCFGGQCKIVDGELTCVCPERYGLEGVGCFETVCKIKRCFGGKCDVKKTKGKPDEEICKCHDGYKLVNDVCKLVLCEKKHCFGGKCVIRNGEEQCDCPEGHVIVNDVCVRSDVRSF